MSGEFATCIGQVIASDGSSPRAHVSPAKFSFLMFLLVSTLLWIAFCYATFAYYKPKYARLRLRHGFFSFMYGTAILMWAASQLVPLLVGVHLFPCWLPFALAVLMMACFNVTNFTRNTSFMLMTRMARATFLYGRLPMDKTAQEEDKLAGKGWVETLGDEVYLILNALVFVVRPAASFENLSHEEHLKTLRMLKVILSVRGLTMMSVMIMIPWVTYAGVFIAATPVLRDGCYGCSPAMEISILGIIIASVFLLSVAIMFTIKCRTMPDNWGLFLEGRISAMGMMVGLLGVVLLGFVRDPVDNAWSYNFIIWMGFNFGYSAGTILQVIIAMREKSYSGGHATKKRRGSNTRSVVDSNSPTSMEGTMKSPLADLKNVPKLNHILVSAAMLKGFELHLSHEFASENLLFLNDVNDWRIAYSDVAENTRNSRFHKIVNTYVSHSGLYQINLPSKIAEDLLKFDNNAKVKYEVFDNARQEIAKLLEIGPVMRFRMSKEYLDIMRGDLVVRDIELASSKNASLKSSRRGPASSEGP